MSGQQVLPYFQPSSLTSSTGEEKSSKNIDIETTRSSPIKRKPSFDPDSNDNDLKRMKLTTPDILNTKINNESDKNNDLTITNNESSPLVSNPECIQSTNGNASNSKSDEKPTKPLTKKQEEKLERRKQRELERLEREKRKEEERLRKEEEKRIKEEERLKKQAEKELEKELRRKKMEEEKLERERKKEEERSKKSAEKEERERQRQEKKRKLEEGKERKEAEKRRAEELKERSQMKISSFFVVGQKIKSSVPKEDNVNKNFKSSNNDFVNEPNVYNKVFLPFFIKKNVKMAQSGELTKDELGRSKSTFDAILKSETTKESTLPDFFKSRKQIIKQMSYTSPQGIVNALNSSQATESQIYEMIQNIPPIKYLQFYENSKPPYIGTWCSSKHQFISFPISDPFNTSITGLDYDYDSDIEWNGEEEGEGEDIDNEDEDDDDEDIGEEDEEMEDFVEDGNDSKRKKKLMGPLIASSRWNDGSDNDFFDEIRYERLHVDIEFSIDPFYDYWQNSKDINSPNEINSHTNSSQANTNDTTAPATTNASTSPHILTPQKKTIKDDNIIFKLIKFIEKNNDFTIGTLVELSKKEFKNFTKALLKHTIQDIASYNKKTYSWEVKPDIKEKYFKDSEATIAN